ncbi:MAG: MtrB/PioB family decaheme-associated outer membrane protein [Gammaproteobacteria bacterium]
MAKQKHRRHEASIGIRLAVGWLVFAAASVGAQEPDTSLWACELCAPSSGWEIDVVAGPGYVSNNAFKFGDYTGLEDDGVYLFGDVFARYWGTDAQYMRLDGYRLGQDSRALFLKGGRLGRYQARASYQGIPRRIFDTTSTPFRGNGTDRLTLPAGWVRAPTTQGMTQLNSSLQGVDIKRDWDIYTAGVSFTPVTRWTFDVDYRRQERDGNDIYSGAVFYTRVAEFTRPIDYESDELEAAIAYREDDWQLRLSYIGSFFDNNNSSLKWDNAYNQIPNPPNPAQMALPPDNTANQISLAGSLLLPANTTLSGQLSLGRMKQDEHLLPYTTNPGSPALPRNSVDGKVDTTNVNLRVTSSPVTAFTVEGEFRYHERDNKTAEDTYNYVDTDAFPAADPATNIAYDYERYDYKLRGEYRLMRQARLHAGYDYQRFDRTHQERNHTDTGRLWTRVKLRPSNLFDIDVELYTEDRDGSQYTPITAVPSPQNDLMRKYNMADRERRGIHSYLSFYSSDRINVGIDAEYTKDDYENSEIGLNDSTFERYGFDVSYLVTRDATAYAAFSHEKIKSRQSNSQAFAAPDWFAHSDDTFYTGTLGLRYPKMIGKLGAEVEYTYARSKGQIENNTGGSSSAFPDERTKLHQVKLGLDYPYSDALSLKFGYRYEKYDTDDWALQDIEPDTVSNLLSLGADPYNYSNHVFFVGVRYVFDSRGRVKPGRPQ